MRAPTYILPIAALLSGCFSKVPDEYCGEDTGAAYTACCEALMHHTCDVCTEPHGAYQLTVIEQCADHLGRSYSYVDGHIPSETYETGCPNPDTGDTDTLIPADEIECEGGGGGPGPEAGNCPEGLYGTWTATYAPNYYNKSTYGGSDCTSGTLALEFSLECDCNASDNDTLCSFVGSGDVSTPSGTQQASDLMGGTQYARCSYASNGSSLHCDITESASGSVIAELDGSFVGVSGLSISSISGDFFASDSCHDSANAEPWGTLNFSRTSSTVSTGGQAIWGSECDCDPPEGPPPPPIPQDYPAALAVYWFGQLTDWQDEQATEAERHADYDEILDDWLAGELIREDQYDLLYEIGHRAIFGYHSDVFFAATVDYHVQQYNDDLMDEDMALIPIVASIDRLFNTWPIYVAP